MQICNWTGIFADTAGFAATVANRLFAPSTAPTFAWGHLLCPHRKKCCATALIFFERSLRFKTCSSIFIVWILKKAKGQKKTSWFLKKFKGGCCRFWTCDTWINSRHQVYIKNIQCYFFPYLQFLFYISIRNYATDSFWVILRSFYFTTIFTTIVCKSITTRKKRSLLMPFAPAVLRTASAHYIPLVPRKITFPKR